MRGQKIKFIDLSLSIESVPSDPENMIPQMEYMDHQAGLVSTQEMFGCRAEDLPLGLGWAVERITLSTHSGTHLDAPWRGKGRKRSIRFLWNGASEMESFWIFAANEMVP
jgi:hypothetical protein